MTRKVRQTILFLTSIFFVLVVPLVLFYSWGYSFDWENKKPVLTGGLYLQSSPKEARVYLNDKLEKETPVFIKRLLPKDYQIRVEKDGFHSWKKKLKIESGLVTEAKDILLIPKELVLEEVEEFPVQETPKEVFHIQEPSYIFYKTDQNNSFQEQISLTPLPVQEYQIFVSNNKRIVVLGKNSQLYLLNPSTKNFELVADNIKGVQFSNDNQKLLFFTSSEIWVFHLGDNSKELITRLSQEIEKAIWHDKTNQHIIFLVNNQLKMTELDGRDERNTIDILGAEIENIVYDLKEGKLYFVLDKKILRTSLE
ncbi:MAG: PEGA domain-containing protein [Candidatus Portnoybacteria bacterium]